MKKLSIVLLFIICLTLTGCRNHTHKFENEVCYCGVYKEVEYIINYDYNTISTDYIDLAPRWYMEDDKFYVYNGTKIVNIHFESNDMFTEVPYLFKFEVSGVNKINDVIVSLPSDTIIGSDEMYDSNINGVIILEDEINEEDLENFEICYKQAYESQRYSLSINGEYLLIEGYGEDLVNILNELGEEQHVSQYPFNNEHFFDIKIECHYNYTEYIKFPFNVIIKGDGPFTKFMNKVLNKKTTGKHIFSNSSLKIVLVTQQED